MDLLNGTGEKMEWPYDGRSYPIPPGELIRVPDECGRHLLSHLSIKGLQEVKYGDDPSEVSWIAISAIMNFHQRMLDDHSAQREAAAEAKKPLPDKSQAVVEAELRVGIYRKVYDQLKAQREQQDAETVEESILANLKTGNEMPDLEAMDQDQLRKRLSELGGDPGQTKSRNKLMAEIKKLAGEVSAAGGAP